MHDPKTKADEKSADWPERPERRVTKIAETRIAGVDHAYTTTAGTLNLKDERGKDRASVFYIEYVLDTGGARGARPITFCFNGGPGSCSMWLQFGAFGPRRIDLPAPEVVPELPYRLVDNAEGLLDVTDLVFIDPVGTGFSRPIGDTKQSAFEDIDADADSLVEFIWRYLSRTNRWNAPRYLAGESYGTTRSAAMAKKLQKRGIALSGLVMLSAVFHFQTLVFEGGNDLPNVLFLPSYAATAWYHGRLGERWPDLETLLRAAHAFAMDEYAPALLRGASLGVERRRVLAARMAELTGLPAEALEKRQLRIADSWFFKTVLGDDRCVGRMDSRYAAHRFDPMAEGNEDADPSFEQPYGAYTAVVNDFARRELGWTSDDDYVPINFKVNEGWRWAHEKQMGFPNVSDELAHSMVSSPGMKVFIAAGYFDLATPWLGMQYALDHLRIPEALRGNVELAFYEAGHMMYFHEGSRMKLRADLVKFYGGEVTG